MVVSCSKKNRSLRKGQASMDWTKFHDARLQWTFKHYWILTGWGYEMFMETNLKQQMREMYTPVN